MADATETTTTLIESSAPPHNGIVFGGETRNMAMGIAMFGAGLAAFISGLTSAVFTEAIAWTFILWGGFFLYSDLLLATRRFIVTDEGLAIRIPLRFWNRAKFWAWKDINRMDVVLDRRSTRAREAHLQVYHQFPGEISLDREDRNFDAELAALIIERARLKADGDAASIDLNNLPLGDALLLTWKR